MTTFYRVISNHVCDRVVWIEGASYKRESMTSFYASILQALKDSFEDGDDNGGDHLLVTVTTNTRPNEIKVFHNNNIELTEFLVVTIQPLSIAILSLSPAQILAWVQSSPLALRYIPQASQTIEMAPIALITGVEHLITNDDARAVVRKLSLEKLDAEVEELRAQLDILQKKRQSFLE